MEHFIDKFLQIADKQGNNSAVSDEYGTFSYSELKDYSLCIAANLKAKGVCHGDRVIIEASRSKEYAACLIGCWLIGAIAIPLSDDYPQDRLDYIKKDSQYKFAIDDNFIKTMDKSLKTEPAVTNLDDEGLVIYTSGSTGNPKGVIHDFKSIAAVAFRNAIHDKTDDTERNNVVGLIAPFTFIVGVGNFICAMSISKHLVIVPDRIRRDPFQLAKYYDDNNIESSFVPPRMVNFMLAHNKSLRSISVGSERITNIYYYDNPVVMNGYGSTELFGGTLAFKIDKLYENTPIGKPIGDERAYVLDDDNNEVEVGELCISGNVAKGYLNRKEETQKAFVKNPFKNIDGFERMFRTGDIVQRLPDGNLVFIERKDWMIKINGQRVEPLEVESTIRRLDGIKEVAVKDFTDDLGVTYLVAYYTLDKAVSAEQIKAYCKSHLTSYMVPAFYVEMKEFLLNANGKLDRINLPKPDIKVYKTEYVAPEGKIEEEICIAMEKTLKCGQIGRNDDFFQLGGDSVKAIETINLLDDLPLSTEMFFTGKTPAGIASQIENGGNAEFGFERVVKNEYPLTPSQLGVYFAMEAESETLMYNNPVQIVLDDDVDIDKLISAIEKAVNNHKAYHCSIDVRGGIPCMIPEDRKISVVRCETDDIEQSLSEFVRPFDLKKDNLIRISLFEKNSQRVIALDAHHIVFDGTTLSILLKEIERTYSGRDLFEEKTSAFDLSTYEEVLKTTEKYATARDYFNNLFEGLEVSNDFPCDYEDKQIAKLSNLELKLKLKTDKLLKFLKENGLTENSLLLAAFSFVLAKYNGTDSSLVCVAEMGRHSSMTFNTAGMLVKTLALPVNLKSQNNVAQYIRHLQEIFRNSVKNDIYPFSELAAKYNINNDFMFVYQGDNFTNLNLNDKKYAVTGLSNPDAINKMTLMVFCAEDGYRLSFRYRSDLYSDAVIEAFANAYCTVVNEFINKELLRDVNLLTEKDEALLDSFCSDEFQIEKKTFTEYFNDFVHKIPNHNLVVYEDKHITYGQAGKITDKVSKYIINLGLRNNDIVSILIPRNEWIVLATYSVLKAGCIYEPLDPSYPKERLSFMVKNAQAKLLITTRELRELIQDYDGNVLYVEDIEALPEAEETIVKNDFDDGFVLLYTSGTTGTPKGLLLSHKNASSLAQIARRKFDLNSDTVNACYASYGFDACFNDLISIGANGGTIHVVPEDMRLNLIELDKYYTDNKITHAIMTTQVGRQFALLTKSPYLKKMGVGGETLVPFDTDNLSFDFYNMYGPSEASVYVSENKVSGKQLRIPIGKIDENTKGYIVDSNMHRLPVGAPGELLVAGCKVGKGYLNLPEKTEASFIDNPFTDNPEYRKVYRTGDIIRFLPDGSLDFIGRHDGQVKVRGFRVELSEIEEVIRRYEGVKDATVAAFDDVSGGKFIAAYIVSDSKIDINALNDFIAEEKPSYMVPAVTMQIDSIPLTQNQKVNKRALPKPVRELENIRLPENDVQKKVYDICCKVLGTDMFGIDTDLYSAGLTSIAVIKLNVELETAFNVPFKVSDIKEHNTVLKIEQFLDSYSAIADYEILENYPLTQTQIGIYIECISEPDSVAYNIPMMIKLGDSIDTEKLANVIKQVFNAHPYTKAILYADDKGNIRALRDDSKKVEIKIIDCDYIPDKKELVKPFKLLGEALYRIAIYRTKEGNYLFMDFHHIASDGMSINIIMADINKAYAGALIKKERYSGFEVSLDEELSRSGESFTSAKEYYDSILKGCNADCLPAKAPESDKKGASAIKRIGQTSAYKVNEYCRRNKFTPNAYFNAAFAYALSFFGNFEDAVYTTIYNGRNDSRLTNSVTMLVKTLPVIVHTEGSIVVADMIQKVQNQLIESMSNDVYSFAEISSAYGVRSDILFAYQGNEFEFDEFCGEKAQFIKVSPDTAKSPITVTVYLKDGKYEINVEYLCEMFNSAFINSFIDVFDKVLNGFAEKKKAEEIEVLSDNAIKQLECINDTDFEFENVPASRLIEKRVRETPDKVAVISSAEQLTYKELNDRANKIAAKLIDSGVKKDSVVGVIIDRSVNIPVCELAVLKAGGAFLPILPDYPDDRIDYCLSDSATKLVLTTKAIRDSKSNLFSQDKPYKAVVIEELLSSGFVSDPVIEPSGDSLAYCIYTSGSTGNPKGVMIEHHSLSNFVQTFTVAKDVYQQKNRGEVGISMGSISFDIHIIDILLPLCNGKTICIATDEEIHNPKAFADFMVDKHVDVIACTPSFIMNILGMPYMEKAFKGLKSIMVGAELFPAGLYEKLIALSPDAYIINAYGPTECTVAASAKHITSSENITIGGPGLNYKMYIMDKFGRRLPLYSTGELIICGEGVSRGYINLPEKTAQAFFECDGSPAYHSGDVARFNSDGELEFGGRVDNQVKLRGYRVELDEIESAIMNYDGIKSAKVVVRNNGSEDYLVGFFTASEKVDLDSLSEYLKSRLTYYMVPDILMQLDAMPLTPNGKIDKKALPEVKKERKQREKKKAKKSLEQELVDIFASVLSLDEFYANDNFFEMGGTSLSASTVTMQLMSKGIKVEYQNIFDNPTPELLADFIESQKIPETNSKATTDDSDVVSEFPEQLMYNTLEYAKEVKREPLGDVVLTGAVGFLGIHVFKELLDANEGKIICIIRKGDFETPEIRLKSMFMYYFGEPIGDEVKDRIIILNGDITDNISQVLNGIHCDTIINCAGCVKHYAADDILERINVGGVENLIKVAMEKSARLIQISTVSIPGAHTDETWKKHIKGYENKLFVIDDMGNKYSLSKYHAEQKMLEAIKNGMRGKIIRVGNLMGRYKDGEFQINFNTNAFLNAVRGFATIGKCPISHATDPMSFSPIDLTAKAVVLLAGTNDMFTAFNADSRFRIDEWQLIAAANSCGITIKPVPDEEYYDDYYRMLGDPKVNSKLQGLMTNDRPDIHGVESDNEFTTNILYRLGFSWNLPDNSYLERILESLLSLDYFELEDEL